MHVASLDRAAVEAAQRVVVLADHTKVDTDSMVQTVPADRIDTLVTDPRADPQELERLTNAGVRLRVAMPAEAFTDERLRVLDAPTR